MSSIINKLFGGYKEVWYRRFDGKVGMRVGTNYFISRKYKCSRGVIISKFEYRQTYSTVTMDGLGWPACGWYIKFDNGRVSDTFINSNHLWQIVKIKRTWKNLWGIRIPDEIQWLKQLKKIPCFVTAIPAWDSIT